ncbi:MAG: hypothetical protein HZB35_04780 [Nitrospirae bacterium]|nr:hypothetical protein [Nitrospirota bacterium]
MKLPDGDGCMAPFQAPEAVRINSPVILGPGSAVMWSTRETTLGPGTVLARMTHLGEDWLLVHFLGYGHVVRVAEVIDVNPHLPLRAAFDVVNSGNDALRAEVAETFMSAFIRPPSS